MVDLDNTIAKSIVDNDRFRDLGAIHGLHLLVTRRRRILLVCLTGRQHGEGVPRDNCTILGDGGGGVNDEKE